MPTPRKEQNKLPMINRLLVSTEDAASLLDLSYFTTSKLIREGVIPSMRIGKVIRVPMQALEEWIDRNTTYGKEREA